MSTLISDIQIAINRASRENASGTPDFILAQYLFACLNAFESATLQRDNWHGLKLGSFKLTKSATPGTDLPPSFVQDVKAGIKKAQP